GDQPDVLVAMNPAALKTHLPDLRLGGMLVANTGAFTASNLENAGVKSNPLEDESLRQNYKLLLIDMDKMTQTAVAGLGLGSEDAARCKNYFALGLMYWLYSREMEPQLESIKEKFAKKPQIADANIAVFKAGYAY